jgi:hypothetical protein
MAQSAAAPTADQFQFAAFDDMHKRSILYPRIHAGEICLYKLKLEPTLGAALIQRKQLFIARRKFG